MKTITSKRFLSLTIVLTLCSICALVLTNTVSSEGPKRNQNRTKEAIKMFDIGFGGRTFNRSEEHTSELQSLRHLVCRLLLEKKKISHCAVIKYTVVCALAQR